MKLRFDTRTLIFIIGGTMIMVFSKANWFGIFYGAFSGFALDQSYKDNESL